jgi:beta-lactamase class A
VDVSRRSAVTAGLLGLLGSREGPGPGGVSLSATDLLTGRRLEHRGEHPCPVLTLSAGLALGKLLRFRGPATLTRVVPIDRDHLVGSSPVCSWHRERGLSVADLADAALRRGDATATNLLVHQAGGRAALTAFCRGLGDGLTRLDRAAPDSCDVAPWDPRDTTTVATLAADHGALVLGSALAPGTRAVLATLFPTTRLPGGWTFTGSTATGRYGTAVTVGTAHRGRRRVLLAASVRSGQPGVRGSARALTPVVADVLDALDRRW